MNRLEYSEVMKCMKIAFLRWHNLKISFGPTSYATVEGNIPLEVAKIIFDKYPENEYGIRINGGCMDWNPNRIFPHYYHIDTKEGLVIFITEMKDYLARIEGKEETEAKRFDELMVSINSEILKKIDPSISTYEWMQADEKNNESFSQTLIEEEKIPFRKQLRKLIDKFDRTINPYLNQDIELDEIKNYIQKVNINGDCYDSENGKDRKNCCRLHITKLGSDDIASYFRNSDGFSYQLQYTLGEDKYLTVLHNYSNRSTPINDEGEFISIEYWGSNIEKRVGIRYNLTTGKAKTTDGEDLQITPDIEKFVSDELLNAIGLAASITIDNMKKKRTAKKSLSNKI